MMEFIYHTLFYGLRCRVEMVRRRRRVDDGDVAAAMKTSLSRSDNETILGSSRSADDDRENLIALD